MSDARLDLAFLSDFEVLKINISCWLFADVPLETLVSARCVDQVCSTAGVANC